MSINDMRIRIGEEYTDDGSIVPTLRVPTSQELAAVLIMDLPNVTEAAEYVGISTDCALMFLEALGGEV